MDPESAKPVAQSAESSAPAMDPKPADSAPVSASENTDAPSSAGDKKQWRDKGVRGNKRKWQQGGNLQHGSRGKRKDIGRGEYMYVPATRRPTAQLINSKSQPTRQARSQ